MGSEIILMPLDEVIALKPYPTADIFPMLLDSADPPAGYDGITMPQFADIILKEGVREPLIIWNGMLLDGRNRREAARQAAAVKPDVLAGLGFMPADISILPVRYADFNDEEEADSWVISLNLARRTINKDQLACIAVKFWEIEAERSKQRSGTRTDLLNKSVQEVDEIVEFGSTRESLSKKFHVSVNYIQKARSLWTNDRPKFDTAASGKERVIGKLVSPGQKINPDTDPNDLALQQINDGFNKIKAALSVLAKSNGDTYSTSKNNISAKIQRLSEQFAEEFAK